MGRKRRKEWTWSRHPVRLSCIMTQEGPLFHSVQDLATRWGCSTDKVARELEKYRGRSGFLDLGVPQRRYRRKKSILRIHPDLLVQIEHDRRK